MNQAFGQVLIILAPAEHAYHQISNIPPLALGVLKGYLTEKEISTDIYDLNVTVNKRMDELPMSMWGFIYDSKRIIDYLRGEPDEEIEAAIRMLVEGIDFAGRTLVGVSLGADFSWLEMHCGMLLAKWIHDKYQVEVEIGGNNVHYLLQFKNDFAQLWEALSQVGLYICVGPGERMLLELVEMIKKGHVNDEIIHSLPGAGWRENDEIKSNLQDAPSLTMPNYAGLDLEPYKVCISASQTPENQRLNEIHLLKWPQPYPLTASAVNRATLTSEERQEILVIPYIFNYNCPYKCAFCVQSGDDKKRVIAKTTDVILDEIEELMEMYQSNYFYFYNNTFNYTPKFVMEFYEGVKKRGLKFYWTDCARFNNLSFDLVKMLYESGCRKLVFGFETGSDKLLKMFDKRLDLGHAENVLRWCKEVGIWADIEVIVGLPYEMEEDFLYTVDFIKRNRDLINHFAMNKYFVVPDSLIGMYPSNYGIKLVRVKKRYEDLLKTNYEFFIKKSKKIGGATNFQVYRYSEVEGRSHSQIVAETNEKVRRLVDVYSELAIAEETKVIEWQFNKVR